MPRKIFTIGYEGTTQDGFITALGWAGVEVVLDVRNKTYTADPGFAPARLAAALERNRVEYISLGDVGAALDPCGHGGQCSAAFAAGIGCCQPSLSAVARAMDIAHARNACLMCYEFDPVVHCHRGLLADRIALATQLSVEHLYVAPPGRFARINPHPPAIVSGF